MAKPYPHITLDEPAVYSFTIQGRIEDAWSDFMKDVAFQHQKQDDGSPVTVVSGLVADQASLHGMLSRIRDLGLPLLQVELVSAHEKHD